MRPALLALALLIHPAMAQEQEALRPPEAPANAAQPFDMVAADRETAWRINRQTGEIVVCRIDTTGSLEAVRARCSPAPIETGPQQSMTPRGGSRP